MTISSTPASPPRPTAETPRPRPLLLRLARGVGRGVVALVGLLAMLWTVGVVAYCLPGPTWLRAAAIAFLTILPLVALVWMRPFRRVALVFAVVFLTGLGLFFSTRASNDRHWTPDVAVLPWAEIHGDRVRIHGIRDFAYRSDADFTPRYRTEDYDLDDLQTADLFIVYWGSPHIAHTMMSFGFADGRQVCFSIETRKEVGESYSAVAGFFRQYELFYVIGTERDLVGLRANHRREDVYLYRLRSPPRLSRLVFLDYLEHANSLRREPEWYNAATSNCTTNIRGHISPYVPGRKRANWRLLVNGYLDTLLYDQHSIARSLPFAELKRQSRVNERAGDASLDDAAFSRRLREGLVEPEPPPATWSGTGRAPAS
jgi:hypothetical protein